MKKWKPIEWAQSPCGSDVEVFTDSPGDTVHDGDEARCVRCGASGGVLVYGNGHASIDWGEDLVFWHGELVSEEETSDGPTI